MSHRPASTAFTVGMAGPYSLGVGVFPPAIDKLFSAPMNMGTN
jgi:hypothetical protein